MWQTINFPLGLAIFTPSFKMHSVRSLLLVCFLISFSTSFTKSRSQVGTWKQCFVNSTLHEVFALWHLVKKWHFSCLSSLSVLHDWHHWPAEVINRYKICLKCIFVLPLQHLYSLTNKQRRWKESVWCATCNKKKHCHHNYLSNHIFFRQLKDKILQAFIGMCSCKNTQWQATKFHPSLNYLYQKCVDVHWAEIKRDGGTPWIGHQSITGLTHWDKRSHYQSRLWAV